MARTITVRDDTFELLAQMTESGAKRTDLLAQIVLQHADHTGARLPRVALPMEKPGDVSPREWHVLIARFEGHVSLARMGQLLGITKERVRQIESKALRKHPEFLVKGEACSQ